MVREIALLAVVGDVGASLAMAGREAALHGVTSVAVVDAQRLALVGSVRRCAVKACIGSKAVVTGNIDSWGTQVEAIGDGGFAGLRATLGDARGLLLVVEAGCMGGIRRKGLASGEAGSRG
jgi:hypothetical protein